MKSMSVIKTYKMYFKAIREISKDQDILNNIENQMNEVLKSIEEEINREKAEKRKAKVRKNSLKYYHTHKILKSNQS